jgi:hypothetical protein
MKKLIGEEYLVTLVNPNDGKYKISKAGVKLGYIWTYYSIADITCNTHIKKFAELIGKAFRTDAAGKFKNKMEITLVSEIN